MHLCNLNVSMNVGRGMASVTKPCTQGEEKRRHQIEKVVIARLRKKVTKGYVSSLPTPETDADDVLISFHSS